MDIYIIGPHQHTKTNHSYLVVAGSDGPYVSHYQHSYKHLVMLMSLKMPGTDTLVPRILVSNGEPSQALPHHHKLQCLMMYVFSRMMDHVSWLTYLVMYSLQIQILKTFLNRTICNSFLKFNVEKFNFEDCFLLQQNCKPNN